MSIEFQDQEYKKWETGGDRDRDREREGEREREREREREGGRGREKRPREDEGQRQLGEEGALGGDCEGDDGADHEAHRRGGHHLRGWIS